MSGEFGDDPAMGKGPGWRWVLELGRHWEPRLGKGHPELGEKRGTPTRCVGDSGTGHPVSELRHPKILSGDSQFADEYRIPGWTAAGRGPPDQPEPNGRGLH